MNTMASTEVWILEDDAVVQNTFVQAFRLQKKSVRCFATLAAFAEHVESSTLDPELLLIDLKLQDVCLYHELQSRNSTLIADWMKRVPSIIVSGRDDREVIETFFNQGAFDYLVKPLSLNELWVKVEKAQSAHLLREIEVQADPPLTPREKRLVEIFIQVGVQSSASTESKSAREGSTERIGLTKSEIFSRVWGSAKTSEGVFEVHLSHLRRKLRTTSYEIRLAGRGKWAMFRKGH
jgi:DNA-binding response OmpR family regulator